MRLRFRAAVLALSLMLGSSPSLSAMEQWCDSDPLVPITTPGGSVVAVYVTNAGRGLEHLPAVAAANISYTVKPVEAGQATLVKVRVVVPGDVFDSHFQTRSTVSTGPLATGTIYATASGYSTEPMDMEFKLPVP